MYIFGEREEGYERRNLKDLYIGVLYLYGIPF
jgi:hypothetical protein